ncbi:MAG: 5-oxoprolinase subunit PxpB [Gammaproteobacteria bacterium]|nr:5-oxoprolinase subunit PxpB [Gammaproteobacteria bacterium]
MTPNIDSRAVLVATPRVARLAEDALLFLFTAAGDNTPPLSLQRRLWAVTEELECRREEMGLLEIVPGMGNLLLRLTASDAHRLQARIDTLTASVLHLWSTLATALSPATADLSSQTITIPVTYGGEAGPDLQIVSAHTGLSEEAIMERHSAGLYRVFCLGFLPGFAYLGGLDPALAIPRRATPRLSIPAGSVAIGGSQTAVYPSATPGGWHIIGRTDVTLFDPASQRPALLLPGDTVRFVVAEKTNGRAA